MESNIWKAIKHEPGHASKIPAMPIANERQKKQEK